MRHGDLGKQGTGLTGALRRDSKSYLIKRLLPSVQVIQHARAALSQESSPAQY